MTKFSASHSRQVAALSSAVLILVGCSPSAGDSEQTWQPVEMHSASPVPPRVKIGGESVQPLVSAWDGSGAPSQTPDQIDWQNLPEISSKPALIVDLEDAMPPERVVVQSFSTVDSAGIPLADSTEVVCTFADTSQCVLSFEPPARLELKFDDALTGYSTIQMSWLHLEADQVSEVWATWGAVIRNE